MTLLTLDNLVALLYFMSAALVAYALGTWFDETVKSYREVYTEETNRHLDDMFLSLNAQQLFNLALIIGAALFLIVFATIGSIEDATHIVATGIISLLVGAVGFMLPRGLVRRLRRQRLHKFNEQLVDAMLTMSNALRAGFSALQAFDMVVKENRRPISEEFSLFLHQHRLGVKFEVALENLTKRVGSQDLDLMVAAIETARQTGGNLTEVFDQLSNVIRERMRVEGKIQSLTAQGRLQAMVVGFMPLILAFAMYSISPQMMRTFLFSVSGMVIIGVALLFELVGYLIIRKIVDIDI